MKKRWIPVAGLLLMLSFQVGAEGLTLTPGLWEIQSTTTSFMTAQPVTRQDTECIKEAKTIDPANMMSDGLDCDILENALDGDTLNFRMSCTMQGQAQATAVGRFQTDGETSNMDMSITFNMGGTDMTMKMQSTGKRVGDC